jgi:N-acylneuraminate cytidylyltransferase
MMELVEPQYAAARSQDLEQMYHDAGRFYWAMSGTWLEKTLLFSERAKAFVLPRHLTQDIDWFDDWEMGEYFFETLLRRNVIEHL